MDAHELPRIIVGAPPQREFPRMFPRVSLAPPWSAKESVKELPRSCPIPHGQNIVADAADVAVAIDDAAAAATATSAWGSSWVAL